VRRLALTSIIVTSTPALLLTGCSVGDDEPVQPSAVPAGSPAAASSPGPAATTKTLPLPSELTSAQLYDLCIAAPGAAEGVEHQPVGDARVEKRNDGLWFIEIEGELPTDLIGYTVCIIEGDSAASTVLASQTGLESEPDANDVYAYDSAAGGE